VLRSYVRSLLFHLCRMGWAASAGGFPAMTEHVAFLMKDVVLFSASVYLLRQDVTRVSSPAKQNRESRAVVLSH
jgi:hypothetical protein